MKQILEFKVDQKTTLLPFIFGLELPYPKKKMKSFLSHGNILVDGKVKTKFDTPLSKGQVVAIDENQRSSAKFPDLDILYEDRDLIVVNKPAGLLTISTDREKERTMYNIVREYVKSKNKNVPIFIVHRLDQDTSGVLLLSKNEKVKHQLQEHWYTVVLERKYLAYVSGNFTKKEGVIHTYLKESDHYRVYSTKNKKEGKEAITCYRVKKEQKERSLVELELKTGRKNQIRVHMSELGHPVLGDKKYGDHTPNQKRLLLHAHILKIIHPITKKVMVFEAPIPKNFK